MKGRSHRNEQPDDWGDGSWTVDCVCGVTFDDGEEMVNCDECGVWVHTRCSRYVKGDESFACDKCKSKNNRNESEEKEVAQLLVELPTKTVRMEGSYGANGPSRRPRLWAERPMEERVHVHGVPGGDPGLFGGLSSVFTPQLWKCNGYVPKKFNFQYKEFPCWDEKEGEAVIEGEEYENPVDKGAGVLFSLSKENALATSIATLDGMRTRDVEGSYDRRADMRHLQNGTKHRSLLPRVVLHSGKRRKEDSGSFKDSSGKKKARAADKEGDRKKKSVHTSKTVFTAPSDAKQLEFNEDRGTMSSKTHSRIIKNRNLKETIPQASVSNFCPAPDSNDERPRKKMATEHPPEALSPDMSKHTFPVDVGRKEEKDALLVTARVESSTKTNVVVASPTEHRDVRSIPIKVEGEGFPLDKSDNIVEDSCRAVVKSPIKDSVSAALELKDNQDLHDSIDDMSHSSVQPSVKVKSDEVENSSRAVMTIQSSPFHEKQPIISTDNESKNSRGNDADHEAQGAERSSTISRCHTDKANESSSIPCGPKQELEGSEAPKAVLPCSSESKHGLGCAEGGTTVSSPAPPGMHKMVVNDGKSCSAPSNIPKSSSPSFNVVIPKSSSSDNIKAEDIQNSNTITKRVVHRSGSNVARNEDSREMARKTVKEHPKSSGNSASKSSHSSRISHSSTSKRNVLDSRDSVLSSSSKASLAHNSVVVAGSGESAGGQQNKITGSGLPQRGEKSNQANVQLSHKGNHTQPMHPPASSKSPATLSDEELALLLHQELNSSPRVPRVPRVRHAGSLPQLASPTATSTLLKRSSSSSGKDHSLGSRRKNKDVSSEGFRSSRERDDDAKKMDRVTSPDQRRHDLAFAADSTKKNIPLAPTLTTNSGGPSSSNEANGHNLSSIRDSPRHLSDDDTGTAVGPVHRTLPGLINEIMSKGQRMTYEELCNAVLPHWHNLRKHNGERYAYSSHSQAVLDCLRNRHEWAQLVDRGPKTNSSRKRRKPDSEITNSEDDNDYGKGRITKEEDSKSLESQHEDFPKGKRKARKRRRLALQGRGVKDIRKKRRKAADSLSDEDSGPFSNSTEESLFSEDEIHGGGTGPVGSEASASSDGTRAT